MYDHFIRLNVMKTTPPKLLPKEFSLESRAVLFTQHHFLFEVFDRKLQQYIEADLINFNLRVFYDEQMNPKKYEKYAEPFAVLTLGELEAGFVVCALPLFLCVLAFGIEWIPSMKSLAIFLFIFKIYFEMKTAEQKQHAFLMQKKFDAASALLREKSNKVTGQDVKDVNV